MKNNQKCGTCRFHTADDQGWFCENPDADVYGLETDYNDGEECVDYESRD